jgi:hypothetical protein
VSSRRPARFAASLLAIATLVAACREQRSGRTAPDTPASEPASGRVVVLADSLAADSAAFRALPPSLRAQLDVRASMTAEALRDTSRAFCQEMGGASRTEERRRLRLRLGPDRDTTLVLFVRADRATGAIRRIELVRRPRGGLQSGFVWDGESGQLSSIDWTADVATATSSAPVPRSSPAPRAVRALGRLLLALPCAGGRVALPGG